MATITTEFYFSEGTGKGAARYDNKTAVFTNKPSIGGVVYDSIIMDDAKQRYQKTLNGQVLTLTPTEQEAIRTYAEQATAVVPADNAVVKTTPQTLSASEQDQAQSNLGLPAKFDEKFDKTGGEITGDIKLNNKDVEVVESSGQGYIRYKSGIQICWATIPKVEVDFGLSWGGMWTNGQEGAILLSNTFAVPFSSPPIVTATSNASQYSSVFGELKATNTGLSNIGLLRGTKGVFYVGYSYIAIGYWK